jgi:hypothetical protein
MRLHLPISRLRGADAHPVKHSLRLSSCGTGPIPGNNLSALIVEKTHREHHEISILRLGRAQQNVEIALLRISDDPLHDL